MATTVSIPDLSAMLDEEMASAMKRFAEVSLAASRAYISAARLDFEGSKDNQRTSDLFDNMDLPLNRAFVFGRKYARPPAAALLKTPAGKNNFLEELGRIGIFTTATEGTTQEASERNYERAREFEHLQQDALADATRLYRVVEDLVDGPEYLLKNVLEKAKAFEEARNNLIKKMNAAIMSQDLEETRSVEATTVISGPSLRPLDIEADTLSQQSEDTDRIGDRTPAPEQSTPERPSTWLFPHSACKQDDKLEFKPDPDSAKPRSDGPNTPEASTHSTATSVLQRPQESSRSDFFQIVEPPRPLSTTALSIQWRLEPPPNDLVKKGSHLTPSLTQPRVSSFPGPDFIICEPLGLKDKNWNYPEIQGSRADKTGLGGYLW